MKMQRWKMQHKIARVKKAANDKYVEGCHPQLFLCQRKIIYQTATSSRTNFVTHHIRKDKCSSKQKQENKQHSGTRDAVLSQHLDQSRRELHQTTHKYESHKE